MATISNKVKNNSLDSLRQGGQYYQPTRSLTGGRNLGDYYNQKFTNQDRSKLNFGTNPFSLNNNQSGAYSIGPLQPAGAGKFGNGASVAGQGTGSALQIPPKGNGQTNAGTLYPQGGGNQSSGGLVTPPQSTGAGQGALSYEQYRNNWMDNKYGAGNWTPSEQQPVRGVLGAPNPSQLAQFTSGLMGASQPNQTQQDYLDQLAKQAKRGEEIAQQSAAIGKKYGSEIDRVGRLGAGAVAGAKSTGTEVVGRGNAQLASESASNRISALSAAQAAELQGVGQQLTAAEQGITGLTNAGNIANTQQQLGISALGTGGNLAMPSPAQYGQTVFDPLTGQYTGAGGQMDPAIQAQTLAQQVMTGAMTYDQAVASLGYAPGGVGQNFLNNALTQAGANPLQLQAQSAGQQANIATQTTAGTDIARQGLAQATQDYIGMTTAAQFAGQQAMAVSNILARTGLNNVSSTDYNRAIRELQGRFSDVERQALETAFIEAQAAYTNLLSMGGGTPTGREAQALGTLNPNSSAAAINASIQELENAVARRLQAQYGALQQYNQNLGTGATTGGATGGGGGFAETW